MSDNAQTSRQLLDIALKTYHAEIASELSGPKRYTGAMIANAVNIAARALDHDNPERALLTALSSGQSADIKSLARAIRSGVITEKTHPGLAGALTVYVRAKLEICNPRFLERRES